MVLTLFEILRIQSWLSGITNRDESKPNLS
jgi:hypothetical protein